MTSDDNNRSNKDGEAIGGSSQTSLMSSTECGIRGPLQEVRGRSAYFVTFLGLQLQLLCSSIALKK